MKISLTITEYLLKFLYSREVLILEVSFESFAHICLFDGLLKRYIHGGYKHKLILVCRTKHCNEYLWDKVVNKCAYNSISIISNNILWNIVSRADTSKYYINHECDTYYTLRNDSHRYPPLNWLDDENDDVRKHFIEFGIKPEDWFVCFFARDDNWDKVQYGKKSQHYFRNSDINNSIDSMKFIIDNGGYVIRLGKTSNNKLNYSHERVVDLPFNSKRNEKSEFYFIKNCRYMISGGSGPADLCIIFDTPIAIVNYPFYDTTLLPSSTYQFIPKLMMNNIDNSVLKYSDYNKIIKSRVPIGQYINTLNENNLHIEDNKESDILLITKKMHELYKHDQFLSLKNDMLVPKPIKISEIFVNKYPQLNQ
jgi:putative glycosyltransferase (TIGR04372 family)